MINVFYDDELMDKSIKSENFWAFDNIEKEQYKDYSVQKPYLFKRVPMEESDFIFLPYKWDGNFIKIMYLLSTGKKVVAFFNDDRTEDDVMKYPENFYIFRTSIYASKISENERIFPAFCEPVVFVPPSENVKNMRIISFCGNEKISIRPYIIMKIIANIHLNTNFIYRHGFWAPEIKDKTIARIEFFNNMRDSLFVLCVRGAGNFSYRLYETLACGRIPIIVNTDMKLPCIEGRWEDVGIIVAVDEIEILHLKINKFLKDKDIEEICLTNQRMWNEYLSPGGFIKNFSEIFNKP